jgi:hypothetical protein
MNSKAGLWIDHKQAIIVVIAGKGQETCLVVSKAEKQPRRSGDSRMKGPYEPKQVPADDIRQRVFTGHLNLYYDAVIAALGNAEAIMILGPGEAKGELKKRLEKIGLGGRITAVEAADKMTKPQIAARVRKYFCK